MKWSIVGLLSFGVLAAVAAVVLVISLQNKSGTDTARAATPEVELGSADVLVAARDIPARAVVAAEDVVVRSIREDLVPLGAYSDPVQVVGRVAILPLQEGQAFTSSSFAAEGSGLHVATALEDGMRAVNVSLNDSMSIEGLLYPGCVVDVIATLDLQTNAGLGNQPLSTTLLRNVMVLAVGSRTVVEASDSDRAEARTHSRSERPTVTLLVNPVQAEKLKLAMSEGSVSLVLCNPMEAEAPESDGVRLSQLSPIIAQAEQEAIAMQLEKVREAEKEREREHEKIRYEMEKERFAIERARSEMEIARDKYEREKFEAEQAKLQQTKPKWETMVMRGSAVELMTFELPSAKTAVRVGEDR